MAALENHIWRMCMNLKTNTPYRELFSMAGTDRNPDVLLLFLNDHQRAKNSPGQCWPVSLEEEVLTLKTAGIIQHSSTESWRSSQLDTAMHIWVPVKLAVIKICTWLYTTYHLYILQSAQLPILLKLQFLKQTLNRSGLWLF